MAITVERFEGLVRDLELKAAKQPRLYKFKAILLGVLGYAYILLVLASLLALVGLLAWGYTRLGHGASVFGKFSFVLLGLALVLARSLWVRVPPPKGIPLSRKEAELLFKTTEEIRRKLKAPKVHRILLDGEFNAAVAQIPRLGILGWQRNYLIVGLPYLHAVSPDQFRAVLAHELGHLSGAHGRSSAWVYRLRRTWEQLLQALVDRDSVATALVFGLFFRWYAPFFAAYSFVLARAQEYEADRASARLAGGRNAADALISTYIKGAFVRQRVWPDIYRTADRRAEPPAAYHTMQRLFSAGITEHEAAVWLEDAMRGQTGSADTHPSLADRLAALGQPSRIPPPVDTSAAEVLLDDSLEQLTARLDAEWRERVSGDWRERHEHVQASVRRLGELDEMALGSALGHQEAWDRAVLNEEFGDAQVALDRYAEVLTLNPDHAPALYATRRLLLSRRDAKGLRFIVRAMDSDPDLIPPGARVAHDFLVAEGRAQEARSYQERAEEHLAVLAAAQEERSDPGPKDTYLPHGLSETELAQLRASLFRFPQLAEAYLVRKHVEHLVDQPLFVLGVVARRPWYRSSPRKQDLRLHLQ